MERADQEGPWETLVLGPASTQMSLPLTCIFYPLSPLLSSSAFLPSLLPLCSLGLPLCGKPPAPLVAVAGTRGMNCLSFTPTHLRFSSSQVSFLCPLCFVLVFPGHQQTPSTFFRPPCTLPFGRLPRRGTEFLAELVSSPTHVHRCPLLSLLSTSESLLYVRHHT